MENYFEKIVKDLNLPENCHLDLKQNGIIVHVYGCEGEHEEYFIPFYDQVNSSLLKCYNFKEGYIYHIEGLHFNFARNIGLVENHAELSDICLKGVLDNHENREEISEFTRRWQERVEGDSTKDIKLFYELDAKLYNLSRLCDLKGLPENTKKFISEDPNNPWDISEEIYYKEIVDRKEEFEDLLYEFLKPSRKFKYPNLIYNLLLEKNE